MRMRFPLWALWVSMIPAASAAAQDKYPVSPSELAAFELLEKESRPVKARAEAEAVLRFVPESFVACYVIGRVYARVEGSLPRAYYFLKKAQGIIESRWGQSVPEDGPWMWQNRILRELITVTAEMDRYEEELALLALHDREFTPPLTAFWGWPLMKLGRMEEARSRIEEALKSEDPDQIVRATNTLGAVESELDHPEMAYGVLTRLVETVRQKNWHMDTVYLGNAGEAALSLLQFDEAERLLVEAARNFNYGTYANPWLLLAMIFVREGRISEAVGATREMNAWSFRNPSSLQQQSWAMRHFLTAGVLLECGYPGEALDILRRARDRPDRRGGTSGHSDQSQAGFLILYRQALKEHREQLAEAASCLPWYRRPRVWLQSLSEGLEMWRAGRQAAALIMKHDRLSWAVRITAPDFLDVLEWTRIHWNEILGPGVVGHEAGRLLSRSDPMGRREEPYLLLTTGYGALLRGKVDSARDLLTRSLAALPPAEVLLKAQGEALLGRALEESGNLPESLVHYQQALQREPGVIRAFGLSLPCHIAAGADAASRMAAGFLSNSPRFHDVGRGFRIDLSASGNALSGTLSAPDGTVLSRVRVPLGPDGPAAVQGFCREFHRKAFAAGADLSQMDIASIEGSNLVGEAVRDQLRTLFRK